MQTRIQHRLGFPLNHMQRHCLPALLATKNVLVSAPTSSGKSALFQIVMLARQKYHRFVYLAPVKCLVQQKARQWASKYPQLRLAQMTSDNELNSLDFDLILATPEKWKSRGDRRHLLLDQLQLVNIEGRGDSLQVVVTRNLIHGDRIIAVSATVPNIKDVSQWLRVDEPEMFTFNNEHRPIPLQKHVLGFKGSNNPFIFQKTLNFRLLQVVRKYSGGGQSLVFCQTQRGTLTAIQQLIHDAIPKEFILNEASITILVNSLPKIQNKDLARVLQHGLAFHHAGLDHEDRRHVERLFKQGHIKVLCATSTLAQGVNLPARLVVIKSTMCYKGTAQGYEQYSRIEMQQMMGRAGRTGYDTEGIVVIMTYQQNVKRYENIARLETLQSHLRGKLHQTINTQVSLRHIIKVHQCYQFLRSTFLAVRMKKVPELYGRRPSDNIQQFLEEEAEKTVKDLVEKQLIRRDGDCLYPDEIGCLLNKKFLSYNTLELGFQELSRIEELTDCLQLMSKSLEYQRFRSKIEERKALSKLNADNSIQLKGAISSYDKKVFVLLVSTWRDAKYQNWQLKRQTEQITFIARRIISLWLKLCYSKGLAICYSLFFRLDKYLTQHCCELAEEDDSAERVFMQVPDMNKKAASSLRALGLTLKQLSITEQKRIEVLAGQPPPFGKIIKAYLDQFLIKQVQFKEKNNDEIELVIERNNSSVGAIILIMKQRQIPTIVRLKENQSKITLTLKTMSFPADLIILFQNMVGLDLWYKFTALQNSTCLNFSTFVKSKLRNPQKAQRNIKKKASKSLDNEKNRKKQSSSVLSAILESEHSDSQHNSKKQKLPIKSIKPQPVRISYIENIQRRRNSVPLGKGRKIQEDTPRPAIKNHHQDSVYEYVRGQHTIINRFRKPQDHYLQMLQTEDIYPTTSNSQTPLSANRQNVTGFKFHQSKVKPSKDNKQNRYDKIMQNYYDYLTEM